MVGMGENQTIGLPFNLNWLRPWAKPHIPNVMISDPFSTSIKFNID